MKKEKKRFKMTKPIRIATIGAACGVVFVTTYSLILPAITMDQETVDEMPGVYLEEDLDDFTLEGDDALDDGDFWEESFDEVDWEEDVFASDDAVWDDLSSIDGMDYDDTYPDDGWALDEEDLGGMEILDGFGAFEEDLDGFGDAGDLPDVELDEAVEEDADLAFLLSDAAEEVADLEELGEEKSYEFHAQIEGAAVTVKVRSTSPLDGAELKLTKLEEEDEDYGFLEVEPEKARELLDRAGYDFYASKIRYYKAAFYQDGEQIWLTDTAKVEFSFAEPISGEDLMVVTVDWSDEEDPFIEESHTARVIDGSIQAANFETSRLGLIALITEDEDALWQDVVEEEPVYFEEENVEDYVEEPVYFEEENVEDYVEEPVYFEEENIDDYVEEPTYFEEENVEDYVEEPVYFEEENTEASFDEITDAIDAEIIAGEGEVIEAPEAFEGTAAIEEEALTIAEETEAMETEAPVIIEETEAPTESLAEEETDAALESVVEEETEEALESLAEEETEAALESLAEEETEEVLESLVEEETEEVLESLVEEETEEALENLYEEETEAVESLEEEETEEPVESLEEETEEEDTEEETEEALYTSGAMTSIGKNYRVTVTYDETAEIPADARLEVIEITEGTPEYEAYRARAEETMSPVSEPDEEITYARFFQIRIITDDAVIEPKAQVEVSINLLDKDTKDQDVLYNALYISEDKTELMEADIEDDIRFETSELS